jgi:spore maturation protein CgeB
LRFVLFYHSLVSDWNHGNAHFLRGVATELLAGGHDIRIYEPENGWSLRNMMREEGAEEAVAGFHASWPGLDSVGFELEKLNVRDALAGADVVLVHEWNDHELVRRIGEHHRQIGGYLLLFHDTHHRSVTDRESMATYDLSGYDGVLAFGEVIRQGYLKNGWARRAWTWHEAADPRVFRPTTAERQEGDLVWVGNWGDDERSAELQEFLIEPVKRLRLKATVYGVRYPPHALRALSDAGINYGGWLPNHAVPEVFSRFALTIHVPRRPYVEALPGIPTIRVFEALACGIPLVSAPWHDSEGLFTVGSEFQMVRSGRQMTDMIDCLLEDPKQARIQANEGLRTIHERHTCAHRVDQLTRILGEIENP